MMATIKERLDDVSTRVRALTFHDQAGMRQALCDLCGIVGNIYDELEDVEEQADSRYEKVNKRISGYANDFDEA